MLLICQNGVIILFSLMKSNVEDLLLYILMQNPNKRLKDGMTQLSRIMAYPEVGVKNQLLGKVHRYEKSEKNILGS